MNEPESRMTIRRRRLARREAEARARGWTGDWPPKRQAPRSAADVRDFLRRLEGGEWRAGLIDTLAVHLPSLGMGVPAEDFGRFGRVVRAVIEADNVAHRTVLRACEAPVQLLERAAECLACLRRARARDAERRLLGQLDQFSEGLGEDGFAECAAVLARLTNTSGPQFNRLRAARALMATARRALKLMKRLPLQFEPELSPEEEAERQRRIEESERALAEIEAEVMRNLSERAQKPTALRHAARSRRERRGR